MDTARVASIVRPTPSADVQDMEGVVKIDNSSTSAPTDTQRVDRLVISIVVEISVEGKAAEIMVGHAVNAMGTKAKVR